MYPISSIQKDHSFSAPKISQFNTNRQYVDGRVLVSNWGVCWTEGGVGMTRVLKWGGMELTGVLNWVGVELTGVLNWGILGAEKVWSLCWTEGYSQNFPFLALFGILGNLKSVNCRYARVLRQNLLKLIQVLETKLNPFSWLIFYLQLGSAKFASLSVWVSTEGVERHQFFLCKCHNHGNHCAPYLQRWNFVSKIRFKVNKRKFKF